MENKIVLSIVNPTGRVYKKEVSTVVVNGKEGEIGFKSGHIPYFVELVPGAVEIYEQAGELAESVYVSGGFVEVSFNKVTILADTADRSSNLNETDILKAKEEAEKLMQDLSSNDSKYDELLSITTQSIAKLDALKRLRKKKF